MQPWFASISLGYGKTIPPQPSHERTPPSLRGKGAGGLGMSDNLHRTVLWLTQHAPGAEHVEIHQCPKGYQIHSRMAGSEEGLPVSAGYRLDVDAAWSVIRVVATWSMAGDSHRLRLQRSPSCEWSDSTGARPDLTGCVDIDIAWTPFTNTLPIRRLGLAIGERRAISVAYIAPPDLTVTPVQQQYTRLATDRWRYEGYPSGFVADLKVDEDGLVVNYPDLFQAVATWNRSGR
jgi:hypothetical protein